jgi:alpha-tubulin suppressor-like RCC1 family protein
MYIASGEKHTVLVSEDGKHVWTFGENVCGQLGHGDNEDRNVPTEIQRIKNELPEDVKIISSNCGWFHTVLLSEDGKHIWTFGDNIHGQLGHGDRGYGTNRNIPTEIHRGENDLPEDVNIVKVSCGDYHTVLLSDDGRIWTFGNNTSGQLGHGDIKHRKVPTEIQRGKNGIPEDVRIIGVSCGRDHTVLLSDDDRIWTFGYNRYGQLGHGDIEDRHVPIEIHRNKNELPEDVRIVRAYCGSDHTGLLSDDGRIWTFGSNRCGQLGHGDNEIRNIPTEIPRGENGLSEDVRIIGASYGSDHTVLLSDDGRIWTFGDNYFGQLGHGNNQNINIPTEIRRRANELPKDVKIICASCGDCYTVLLSDDGRIWTFGFNIFGQLGHGNTGNRNIPTEIRDLSLRRFGSLTKSANKS